MHKMCTIIKCIITTTSAQVLSNKILVMQQLRLTVVNTSTLHVFSSVVECGFFDSSLIGCALSFLFELHHICFVVRSSFNYHCAI